MSIVLLIQALFEIFFVFKFAWSIFYSQQIKMEFWSMKSQGAINISVAEVKSSLDDIQSIVLNESCSHETLMRLRYALADINEEVNMLSNVMQMETTNN